MTVAEKERALLEELAVFPDPQERLAHLVRRSGRGPVLSPEEQVPGALVPGCVSRVWMTASLDGGRCRFRVAADSPMVLGLMRLLCDLYDGATPEDVVASESDLLSRSGLDRHLSPTRRQGLSHARARLRALAAAWLE
jgi:cysteine desulfuration protein SufE